MAIFTDEQLEIYDLKSIDNVSRHSINDDSANLNEIATKVDKMVP